MFKKSGILSFSPLNFLDIHSFSSSVQLHSAVPDNSFHAFALEYHQKFIFIVLTMHADVLMHHYEPIIADELYERHVYLLLANKSDEFMSVSM